MRRGLLAVFCAVCFITAANVAAAQQNQTPENKDKNAAEKAADKAKEAGRKSAIKLAT
jgi:organic hydroperoxide reductase OsmC/OhrA